MVERSVNSESVIFLCGFFFFLIYATVVGSKVVSMQQTHSHTVLSPPASLQHILK